MLKRWLFIILGLLSLTVGGIGVVIPILPTTPFVLLSALLFSVSSPKLAKTLENNHMFGPYITHYRNKTGVPMRTKKEALIWLWSSLGISAILIRRPVVMLILLVVGIGVSSHILLLKTQSEGMDLRQAVEQEHAQKEQQQDA